MPLGQGADAPSCLVVDPAGDEPLDPAVVVDDPEGGVLGADQRPDAIDDDLQGVIDRGQAGDTANRGIEGGVDLAQAWRRLRSDRASGTRIATHARRYRCRRALHNGPDVTGGSHATQG